MSSIMFHKSDLAALIDHQIALIERFDPDSGLAFSVVYFRVPENFELNDMLQSTLRKTDAMFRDEKDVVLLLSGTDWSGSLEVLKGIENFLNQQYRELSVSYPYDGKDSATLISKLQKIVKENYGEGVDILRKN